MPGSRLSKRSLPNFFKPAQRVEDLLGNLVLTRQRRLRDYIWLSLYPARGSVAAGPTPGAKLRRNLLLINGCHPLRGLFLRVPTILGFRFAPPQALCFHPLRGLNKKPIGYFV